MARNRGKPKLSSRDINKQPLSEEEHRAQEHAFYEGPPIATAIIGAAIIEYELDDLLRLKLARNDDNTWALVTGDNGPFGTFGAKIVAGYAFDIYDYQMFRNLHVVRTIRNAFAHSQRIISFDHPLIAVELAKIELPIRNNSKRARNLAEARDIQYGGRVSYVFLCTDILLRLMGRATQLVRNRERYYRKAAEKGWESVLQMIKEHPEPLAAAQRLYREIQNDDPTVLAPFASLGRIPKRTRKEGG